MDEDSTAINPVRDLLGKPEPEPAVLRGDTCFFCPELRERVTQTHTMVSDQGRRLELIESKIDSMQMSVASAASSSASALSIGTEQRQELSAVLKVIAERDKTIAVDLALLKHDMRVSAGMVSAIVSVLLGFGWWLFSKVFSGHAVQ